MRTRCVDGTRGSETEVKTKEIARAEPTREEIARVLELCAGLGPEVCAGCVFRSSWISDCRRELLPAACWRPREPLIE